MSDPTVRPLTTPGAMRPSFNLDLSFLLNSFRALGHPDPKDAILKSRFHLVSFVKSVLLQSLEDNMERMEAKW